MLEGKRPSDCQYCWDIEDMKDGDGNSLISDRTIKSSDSWAKKHILDLPGRGPLYRVTPSYVEVSFSNLCNFKCSYCSPLYSSRWMEEIESKGPYPTSARFGNLEWHKENNEIPIHHSQPNPYVEAFWDWWPTLVGELDVFRITGGEPLLCDDTCKVMDYLIAHPKPKLKFYVNTNACVPSKFFNQFTQRAKILLENRSVREFTIYTSIDGWGAQAEYGRHGLDVNEWHQNIKQILSELPDSKVVVMCTTNIFSATSLLTLLERILELKILFSGFVNGERVVIDANILRYPHHQSIGILPSELHQHFMECCEFMEKNQICYQEKKPGFLDFEINKIRVVANYHRNELQLGGGGSLSHARLDFFNFVNEHDIRRKTDFLSTFPELVEFYEKCGLVNGFVD